MSEKERTKLISDAVDEVSKLSTQEQGVTLVAILSLVFRESVVQTKLLKRILGMLTWIVFGIGLLCFYTFKIWKHL